MLYLHRCREVIKEQWEQGYFQNEDDRASARATDAALHELKVLKELIELDFDRYIGVMHDDDPKQLGPESSRTSGAV